MAMPGKELLIRSGQNGKLWFGGALVCLSVVILGAAGYLARDFSSTEVFVASILATIIGAIGFAYTCRSVRCPKCGTRWFWRMVSKRPGDPRHWSIQHDSCNECEYDGRGGAR